jgi:hydroxymethylbilane synthase
VRTSLVVGTRASQLARVQTGLVVAALQKLHPQLKVEVRLITTAGDKDRKTQLEDLGTNVFVKELEEALLDGGIDLAVHSLKDVPTDFPAGLGLAAIPKREDPRDVLVSKISLEKLPAGARIGTGSLRRSIQLGMFRPDLQMVSIRGNVDTRVKKVDSGEVEGVVLAAAGLSRLGLTDKICQYLPLDDFLPAVGQGALALEARLADKDIADLVEPLNDEAARASVTAERAFLLELGGGCRAPIAALGRVHEGRLYLEGLIASLNGQQILKDSQEGAAGEAEDVGKRLARKMLKAGAREFIDEVRRIESR